MDDHTSGLLDHLQICGILKEYVGQVLSLESSANRRIAVRVVKCPSQSVRASNRMLTIVENIAQEEIVKNHSSRNIREQFEHVTVKRRIPEMIQHLIEAIGIGA
jgi:hypothetical protein